jgi:hypothetical protein
MALHLSNPSEVQVIAAHFGVTIDEAKILLRAYRSDELLSGQILTTGSYAGASPPVASKSVVGSTAGELSSALGIMEDAIPAGGKLQVQLCTDNMPTDGDLAELYLSMVARGMNPSYPTAVVTDGVPTTTFTLQKTAPAAYAGGHVNTGQFGEMIAILPTIFIVGLIAFGITQIGNISSALLPVIITVVVGAVAVAVIVAVTVNKAPKQLVEAGAQRLMPRTLGRRDYFMRECLENHSMKECALLYDKKYGIEPGEYEHKRRMDEERAERGNFMPSTVEMEPETWPEFETARKEGKNWAATQGAVSGDVPGMLRLLVVSPGRDKTETKLRHLYGDAAFNIAEGNGFIGGLGAENPAKRVMHITEKGIRYLKSVAAGKKYVMFLSGASAGSIVEVSSWKREEEDLRKRNIAPPSVRYLPDTINERYLPYAGSVYPDRLEWIGHFPDTSVQVVVQGYDTKRLPDPEKMLKYSQVVLPSDLLTEEHLGLVYRKRIPFAGAADDHVSWFMYTEDNLPVSVELVGAAGLGANDLTDIFNNSTTKIQGVMIPDTEPAMDIDFSQRLQGEFGKGFGRKAMPEPLAFGATKVEPGSPYSFAYFTNEARAGEFQEELLRIGKDARLLPASEGRYSVRWPSEGPRPENIPQGISPVPEGLNKTVDEERAAANTYEGRKTEAKLEGDQKTVGVYDHLIKEEHEHENMAMDRLLELGGGTMKYVADSAEYMSQTVDSTGWREKIDTAFQEAMKRTGG